MTLRREPMTPEEYLMTIPALTGYAGVLLTDEDGGPLMMRSVYRAHDWQMPGGNLDHDEDMLGTALREMAEETGVVRSRDVPVLTVEFMHAGPAWPRPKIGMVFDGGCLTRDEIAAIRLSPEHDRIETRPMDAWRADLTPQRFVRVEAALQARQGGARFLVTDELAERVPPQR